jgi:UPF0271 protein
MTPEIDLNCDLGEGIGNDAALMPLISSASIACGAHAGDESTMRATVRLAMRHGVAIGAHPGYADRSSFGRIELRLGASETEALVASQIRLMLEICRDLGARMNHVKPHGALYNRACRDRSVADAVVRAITGVDSGSLLFAPAGSALWDAAQTAGITPVAEIFADRTYQRDGRLTPRSRPGAILADPTAAAQQAVRAVRKGRIVATDGGEVVVAAQTVCVHGDAPHAVAVLAAVHRALITDGVVIAAPARSA